MDATKTKFYKDRAKYYKKCLKEGRITKEQVAEFNRKNVEYLVENFSDCSYPKERYSFFDRLKKLDERGGELLDRIDYDYVKIFFIVLVVVWVFYKAADIYFNHRLSDYKCVEKIIMICAIPDSIFYRTDTFYHKARRNIPWGVKKYYYKTEGVFISSYEYIRSGFEEISKNIKNLYAKEDDIDDESSKEVKRE